MEKSRFYLPEEQRKTVFELIQLLIDSNLSDYENNMAMREPMEIIANAYEIFRYQEVKNAFESAIFNDSCSYDLYVNREDFDNLNCEEVDLCFLKLYAFVTNEKNPIGIIQEEHVNRTDSNIEDYNDICMVIRDIVNSHTYTDDEYTKIYNKIIKFLVLGMVDNK